MNTKFPEPYIIFFPVVSSDGMPFETNKFIKGAQGELFSDEKAWRGTIVVAKYTDLEYSGMEDASMADFPLINNYLSNHECGI